MKTNTFTLLSVFFDPILETWICFGTLKGPLANKSLGSTLFASSSENNKYDAMWRMAKWLTRFNVEVL